MRYILTLAALAFGLTASAQSELYPQHFDLEEVTLMEGPLKTAQDLNIQHLMSYDVDRLLTPFVRQAGLSNTTDTKNKYYHWTTKHPNFANWGGDAGFDLSGHVGGHYMTALALAYASCHDAETRAQVRERIDYMVAILKDCQDAYDSDQTGLYGFLGGQPINANWQALYKGDVSGFWNGCQAVPFYCQHKVLAGLRDLAVYTDGETASTALEMFRKMADWSVNLVANLSTDQMQGILNTEHGGMNETLVDAYRLFGDQKYLTAAKKYSHQSMIDGMQSLDTNFLSGKHANTQVPKYIGFERICQEDKSATTYRTAALNFWQDVTQNRTVCIGGNSVNEHFLSNNGDAYISELDGPESCNSNNMLKLSEDLFDTYHDSKYADFYEGTMYNHILATQDPETGGYVYFTPLRPQQYRIYSKPNQDMWCCVGTGMENHVKYGHFIYTHDGTNTLYVNLFVNSKLEDETFSLTQETNYPEEQSTRVIINKDGEYTLAIRKPSWVGEGFSVSLNGTQQEVTLTKGYATFAASFKQGDVVEVKLPMSLRYEALPNQSDYIAFKYGPVLLGARTTKVNADDEGDLPYEALTHEYAAGERMGHSPGSYTSKSDLAQMPMLLGERSQVLGRIQPVEGQPLTFTLDATRTDDQAENYTWKSLTLEPYYTLHHSRTSIYFYQQTMENYQNSSWAQQEQESKKLEGRTVDQVDMGKQQSEAGVVTASSDSNKGTYKDEDYRDTQANGWMQIVLTDTLKDCKNLSLMLRYTTADKGRMCKIYVNDQLLKDYTVPSSAVGANSNGFYNEEIPLGDLALDENGNQQTQFVVRIVASATTPNPGLYYIRLMKDFPWYRFNAEDWGYTGDAGRVAQDKIEVDKEANTITMTQSGTNNICLKYGAVSNLQVPLTQKYLVIRGTNLSRLTGKSYLWWLNGVNKGSQVAPTKSSKLDDGRTQLVWDITQSSLDGNSQTDPWTLTTSYNAGSTIFGLTATNASKPVTISYIGFLSEEQLNGSAIEPEGDQVSSPFEEGHTRYVTLSGMASEQPTHGINLVRQHDGKYRKIIRP